MEKLDNTKKDKVRKLASIQEIANLSPIKKMDRIVLAEILGWKTIVRKDEFNIGDKVVYFEIDSLLPKGAWWTEGFSKDRLRIKTIKISGQISQGTVMPLSILAKEKDAPVNTDDYPVGTDVTDLLGVTKYEDDADGAFPKGQKIPFPEQLIEKSDEPRIQAETEMLEKFKGKKFYSTLKYDGSSVTFVIDPTDKTFYVCSRNLVQNPSEKNNMYNDAAKKYDIKNKLLSTGCKYAIQAEVYGPKIQKNPLKVKELNIAVYTVRDLEAKRYLDMEELIEVCKKLDLPMVEIIEKGDNFNYTLEQLIEKSKGKYPGIDANREGLVYRVQENWFSPPERLSFKVINNDYLLKDK